MATAKESLRWALQQRDWTGVQNFGSMAGDAIVHLPQVYYRILKKANPVHIILGSSVTCSWALGDQIVPQGVQRDHAFLAKGMVPHDRISRSWDRRCLGPVYGRRLLPFLAIGLSITKGKTQFWLKCHFHQHLIFRNIESSGPRYKQKWFRKEPFLFVVQKSDIWYLTSELIGKVPITILRCEY